MYISLVLYYINSHLSIYNLPLLCLLNIYDVLKVFFEYASFVISACSKNKIRLLASPVSFSGRKASLCTVLYVNRQISETGPNKGIRESDLIFTACFLSEQALNPCPCHLLWKQSHPILNYAILRIS
jgi:hypothetical protein